MVAIVILYESRTLERNVHPIERTLKASIRGFLNHAICDRDNLYCLRSFSNTFASTAAYRTSRLIAALCCKYMVNRFDCKVVNELVFLVYDIVLGVCRCIQC